MATETISLTELRLRLSDLVDQAHQRFDRFLITRPRRSGAPLLRGARGLLETLNILSDQDLVRQFVEADRELSDGGGHTPEGVRGAARRAEA